MNDNGKRVALITGGAGDLGFAAAQRMAAAGYSVVVCDTNTEKSASAAMRLPGSGHTGFAMDVSDESAVAAGFERAEHDTGPVSVLLTVAGILALGPDGTQSSIYDISLEQWERTFAVNARGTFLCIREFARRRKVVPVEFGRIITVASSGAQLGGYQSKNAYCASKGAVLSLTKAVARELAPLNITVNCIAPGPFETGLMQASRGGGTRSGVFDAMALLPLQRVGQPHEFAAAVEYLASPDAGFSTGSTIDLNGGLRMQ